MITLETNQKFIFVTGPSESGKSGGINYIKDNYPDYFKHLKIRNIFPAIYAEMQTQLSFQEWYDYEYENNFEEHWDRYILKAIEMSDGKPFIIMDTMYGVKTIQYLYSVLKEQLGVLYIDADYEKRVEREYKRLRTDSTHSDRKADLTITLEEVKIKTNKKDSTKKKKETFEYKDLVYQDGSIIVGNRELNIPFSYLIVNNGTIEDFHTDLDAYAKKEILAINDNSLSRKRKYFK